LLSKDFWRMMPLSESEFTKFENFQNQVLFI